MVQINGIDYKIKETAVSPSAQQILAENRESAQNILQSSIEQEIGQEVKAVELNETLYNVKDELARNNILKEASTRASADATLNNNINTINSKIPSQASSTNQLADKDFVNSSILQFQQDISGKLDVTGSNGTITGVNALINKLTTGDAIPSDPDYFISQYANGGTTNTTFHRRPVSKLWDYIKSKADSVYAKLSHTHNYAGSSSAGGSATSAISVVDYNDIKRTIKIGYAGPSLTPSQLTNIAGYTDNGTQIKDVSQSTLKSWLDLGSAPYIDTLDIAISSKVSVTMNTFTSNAINAPVATDGLVITHHLSSTRASQLALCGAQLFTRKLSGTTWSAWNAMWNTQES